MKMGKSRLDDSLYVLLVGIGAVLAFGLQVSVSQGYVLDRGAAQARADEMAEQVRTARAASDAARRNAVAVVMPDPAMAPAVGRP